MFLFGVIIYYLRCVDARFIRSALQNEITNENLTKFRNDFDEARKTATKIMNFQTPDVNITDVINLLKETVNATEEVNPSTRLTRQENDDDYNDVEVNSSGATNATKESQESEEEDTNMVTGLISAFLGGLSRPDGGVDVEAITGLLGSLSAQKDDGTYDFSGLTDLLMSLFGGDEEGGGSDFGAFIGGIAGALIKGVANPPGAKGTGIFLGKILSGVLPALSAPAPTEEGAMGKPQPPLDSGNFLVGFIQSFLSGSSADGNGDSNSEGGGGSKFSLFKAIFSIISSFITASSSGKH